MHTPFGCAGPSSRDVHYTSVGEFAGDVRHLGAVMFNVGDERMVHKTVTTSGKVVQVNAPLAARSTGGAASAGGASGKAGASAGSPASSGPGRPDAGSTGGASPSAAESSRRLLQRASRARARRCRTSRSRAASRSRPCGTFSPLSASAGGDVAFIVVFFPFGILSAPLDDMRLWVWLMLTM